MQAIVTDLATTEYLASSELKHAVVVGKFNAPSGNDWGVLLSKGSSLLPCVNHAIQTLTNNGTLAALHSKWIPQDATDSVPEEVSAPGAAAATLGMLAQL